MASLAKNSGRRAQKTQEITQTSLPGKNEGHKKYSPPVLVAIRTS
jgi:hypothetical protein